MSSARVANGGLLISIMGIDGKIVGVVRLMSYDSHMDLS